MDDGKLKARIGANIAFYRKQAGMTQAGLAEKLNYSDKAVSKWERGESVPDVLTLIQMASEFRITVNDLVGDVNALPDNPGTLERAMSQVSERALKRKANKNIILGLSTTLVWFVMLSLFVVMSTLDMGYSWVPFVYAVPITAIVLLSLRSAWRDFRWNKILISTIVWGSLTCIYVTLIAVRQFYAPMVFLLGIPGQIAIFLWFRMFRVNAGKDTPHE